MSTTSEILSLEAPIRLGCFAGIFAIMALWELAAPRRRLVASKGARWFSNVSIVVVDAVLLRIVFPTAAIGVAVIAQRGGWGLLNHFDVAAPWAVLVAVVVLDMAVYLQHVMFHAVPALWRLHRMHHADPDFDVTTGARFHPIEILLSMLIKLAVVAALGAPPLAVLVFEVLLNGTAMFNHANIRLPEPVDRLLRLVVVTPDMHRVHHSVHPEETDSNFGFNLPWWDRLFGTYRAAPRDGHEAMTIGLREWRDPAHCIRLAGMLAMPFRGTDRPATFGQRERGHDD